jgi:hypothetical protein
MVVGGWDTGNSMGMRGKHDTVIKELKKRGKDRVGEQRIA